jgi:uncharacterized protein YabE (DUF348 family)
VGVLFFAGLAGRVSAESGAKPGSNGTIITLHDRGVEYVFVTDEATIGDALEQADVNIAEQDRVEPALDETLAASEYTVNIYRARPLVVVDGSLRKKIMTASQSPEQIAKDAGITLYPEDTTTFRRADNIVMSGASEEFVVKRATPFTFTLYGDTFTARTQAKTVEAMLKEKRITLDKNDRMSVSGTTPVTKDMTIRVWREGKQTVTVDEELPFEVEQIRDANRPLGYKELKTQGVNGQRSVTYEVVIQDGVEVSRTEIASVTKKPAEKQVEIIGTKVSLPPGSHEDWMAAAGMSPGDYGYINYIFSRESGWRPNAANPSGKYYGLGQTNLSKLSSACPNWQSDPICQIGLFNSYAVGRYGSWAAAYDFWTENHWW